MSSGVASARKSSTPASSAMPCAVSGLSPVIITVRMPIAPQLGEPLAHPLLDDVLEVDHAERPSGLPSDARRPAAGCRRRWRSRRRRPPTPSVGCPPLSRDPLHDRGGGALADLPRRRRQVDAAHPGLGGERRRTARVRSSPGPALAQAVRGLGQDHDGPSLRGLVGQAGQLRGVGQVVGVDAGDGTNSAACRLPRVMVPVLSSSRVLTSPAASTARPDMASTLCCTSRSIPAMPIADSSAPMVVGIRQTSSATSTTMRLRRAGVDRRTAAASTITSRNTIVRLASRMFSAISLGVFCRDRALDQGDHPVDEGLAGLGGDLDDDPVGEHLGAAGDRADRSPPDSRITGADSPVIADSSTLATPSTTSPSPGMISPASTTTRSPSLQLGGRRPPPRCRRRAAGGRSSRSWLARRVAAWALPRPSATASARLANTHGEPQPHRRPTRRTRSGR